MGISYDYKGYLSRETIEKNQAEQSSNSEKTDSSQTKKKKRYLSTDITDNPKLIKKYNKQIGIQSEDNKKEEEEKNMKKTNQKNKLYKCLSYEKLLKIEDPNKIPNTETKRNSFYEGGKAHASNLELNKKILSEEYQDEEEDLYKDTDNDNDISVENDSEPNSNSASNKELQIIDENMKTVFLNSSIKEEKEKEKVKEKEELLIQHQSKKEDNSDLNNSVIESVVDYELIFYKTANELRNSYIQKLVSKALYLPNNKPKTHNSLIIFDWDDTLLPTSFLTKGGVFNEDIVLNENDKKKMEKLENSALNLLNNAITKGDVYIITNAGLGWVEYSANRFYPKVYEILSKIQIISARGEWEKAFPGDSRKWKIQTFLSLEKRLNTKLVTNIICLGDSLFEIEAGRVLANCFREAFVKTIKFKEGPKLDELNKQLLLVANQFNSICSAVKNLTIRVEKKKKGQ